MIYENDLRQRMVKYGNSVLLICKKAKSWNDRIVCQQLFRSATSSGANYMEADGTETKNDFIHKLSISRKELKESWYWLNILKNSKFEFEYTEAAIQETIELTKIISSIIRKLK